MDFISGLAQTIEAGAQQPLSSREIPSSGSQLPFESETTGIIGAQAVSFCKIFEPSNRIFGGVEVSAPDRNGATTPTQRETERHGMAEGLRPGQSVPGGLSALI